MSKFTQIAISSVHTKKSSLIESIFGKHDTLIIKKVYI